MMDTRHAPDDDWLLDDQLGLLSDDDRQRLHERLRDDPELAARHRRLQRVLEPLDAWTTPPPPADLVERILDDIADRHENAPVVREVFLPYGGSGGRRLAMHDLLAVAAVIAFFFAILFPSMSVVRQRSHRAACASNLATVGRGVSAYALANRDALPYQPVGGRSSFLPAGGARSAHVVYAPNSRSLMLIARLRLVPVRVFICPSGKRRVPLKYTDLDAPGAAPDVQLCNYDSLNMAGATPSYSAAARLPYMSDANPLFADQKFNAVNPVVTNSPNHGKRGQNILLLDGTVRWSIDPNSGHRNDNIWQAGNITRYTGTEVQESADDTFLVP